MASKNGIGCSEKRQNDRHGKGPDQNGKDNRLKDGRDGGLVHSKGNEKTFCSLPRFGPFICGRAFRHQHDMRKFILSALLERDQEKVVILLGDTGRGGIDRLRQILQAHFEVDARNHAKRISFQRVAVPLCQLLTQRTFCNSTNTHNLYVIYGAVLTETNFFPRYVSCIKALAERGVSERGIYSDDSTYCPSTLVEVTEPFVNLCHILLTRLPAGRAYGGWNSILSDLSGVLSEMMAQAGVTPSSSAIVKLDQCFKIVSEVAYVKEARVRAPVSKDDDLAQIIGAAAIASQEMLPGDLKLGGPLHDNDHSDFRQIRVLPTAEEMLCTASPYLPRQSDAHHQYASCFVPNGPDRHLDILFRLTREDLLAPVRRSMKAFVTESISKRLCETRNTFQSRGAQDDMVQCILLWDLVLEGVSLRENEGCCFSLSFQQPLQAKSEKNFWTDGTGSRWLLPNSLVCLALNVKRLLGGASSKQKEREGNGNHDETKSSPDPRVLNTAGARFYFAEVQYHSRETLNNPHASRQEIVVRAFSDKDTLELLGYLCRRHSPRRCHVMFQVYGHFMAGTHPVLERLQALRPAIIPLLDELVPQFDPAKPARGEAMKDAIVQIPAYLEEATNFDLSCIVKTENTKTINALKDLAITDYDSLVRVLQKHASELMLDRTQIEAFACGLTRRIALIQGPPGTGKTYIGVRLVQVLLQNSHLFPGSGEGGHSPSEWAALMGEQGRKAFPPILPILCIAYTNHALDQFLEDLVDTGVVPLSQVIRIGSRSKSERLSQVSLEGAARAGRTFSERSFYASLRNECSKLKYRIVSNVDISRSTVSMEHLEDFLRKYDEDLWVDILQASEHTLQKKHENEKDSSKNLKVVGGFKAQVKNWISAGLDDEEREIRNRKIQEYKILAKEIAKEGLSEDIESYNKLAQRMRDVNDASRLRVLRQAHIIGCTTSAAAKYGKLMESLEPRVILCEEAAEVFESHLLSALTPETEHLILIGDHLQLRPKPNEYSMTVESRAYGYNLDISLFERLVLKSSFPVVSLDVQRRMRPEIADLIRQKLYPYLLDAMDVVGQYPQAPQGFEKPLYFLSHNHSEQGDKGMQLRTSWGNPWEARMISALVRYILRQGYKPDQIAVLTPYLRQLRLLHQHLESEKIVVCIDDRDIAALERKGGTVSNEREEEETQEGSREGGENGRATVQATVSSLREGIRLTTVDNFQGEEAEIILLSTVRCNRFGRMGFLRSENRINVMLSRAKHGMYILGSAFTIYKDHRASMFHQILGHMEERGEIGDHLELCCPRHGDIKRISEPDEVPPDGGCMRSCNARKVCGHKCRRMCHPDDPAHHLNTCIEPCARVIPTCGHPCRRLCKAPCGGCKVECEWNLPCGHTLAGKCQDKDEEKHCTFVFRDVEIQGCGLPYVSGTLNASVKKFV